jgi:hypothetical protein
MSTVQKRRGGYYVQFSTGLGSAEVGRRSVEKYGAENVTLLTADTLVEDEDNWRFAHEARALMGMPAWVILTDGRTPMQAGRDARVVPNNRFAVCSRILKRELLRSWIDANLDPAETVIQLGYDWTEPHRHASAAPLWLPYKVESPLMDPPYAHKPALMTEWATRGIKPPRLYDYGFSHANCGGACVRGGQAQWQLLLTVNRDRYLMWEREEETTREMLGKDVTILRDRTDGETRPLSLRKFRLRIEADGTLFDTEDWGACGCTMPSDGDEPVLLQFGRRPNPRVVHHPLGIAA